MRKSGRYRARYQHPVTTERYNAPRTFTARKDAEAWLASQLVAIDNGTWHPGTPLLAAGPKVHAKKGGITLGEYGDKWIKERRNSKGMPLEVRTTNEYFRLFRTGPLAELGTESLRSINSERVREWFAEAPELGPRRRGRNGAEGKKELPNHTQAGHAYSLLASIMKTAVEDGLIAATPCKIKGGD